MNLPLTGETAHFARFFGQKPLIIIKLDGVDLSLIENLDEDDKKCQERGVRRDERDEGDDPDLGYFGVDKRLLIKGLSIDQIFGLWAEIWNPNSPEGVTPRALSAQPSKGLGWPATERVARISPYAEKEMDESTLPKGIQFKYLRVPMTSTRAGEGRWSPPGPD